MATHIRANGDTEDVTPMNGEYFTLAELQHFVQGYIELVHLPDGRHMYVNEEGKLNDLPLNPEATRLYGGHSHDYIVGDVIIVSDAEEPELRKQIEESSKALLEAEMTPDHTPLPWQIDEVQSRNGPALRIVHVWQESDDDDPITRTDDICDMVPDYAPGVEAANAALIVRAVNNHETLKKALAVACDALDSMHEAVDLTGYGDFATEEQSARRNEIEAVAMAVQIEARALLNELETK